MEFPYLLSIVGIALAGTCLAASIESPAMVPSSAATGAAATVRVTARIADPAVIPSSVNLQQLDSQGRAIAVIGLLADDGLNGDAVAGDRTYTIRFTVFQQQPGTITYRVSAGVLGSLNRIFSAPLPFTVTGPATGIAITQPANLAFVGLSPIIIAGTVGDPNAAVTVNGIAAPRNGNAFQVSIPLQEGKNTITAVAANSNHTAGTASIEVTLDTTPPHVSIDSPASGSSTIDTTVDVSGLVNDIVLGTVNSRQATVMVNGVAGEVANRHYIARGVPLVAGENTLQVVARDQTGNSVTAISKVVRETAGPQIIRIVSGNDQSAAAGTALPAPLVVRLTNNGAAAANVPVIFKIVDNDGFLQPGTGKPNLIAANTDAQGQARANLTLGHRSGAGNNIVQAYAAGFQGIALFTASGTPGAATSIYVDSGSGQFGPIGLPLVLPLVAVVADDANNRIAGVPVTFSIAQGGGNFGGQPRVQVLTDGDGRASAVLTLGSQPGQDNNLVGASFQGMRGLPARFAASGKLPGDPDQTTISGVVLDNSNNPIPGVSMRLFRTNQGSNNNQPIQVGTPVATDAKGLFRIAPAPVGFFKLMADGATATVPGKNFPTLEYDIVTTAGQDNGVGTPIYLPALDPGSRACVTATTGGEVKIPASPGYSLKILPGSATFPGGSKTGCASATPVNQDKIPMVPGFGRQPRFIVTIQPIGTTFSPPAAMTVPNLTGLPPYAKTEMYSYDHDLASFVTVGPATVSPDGSVVTSDPGVGVLKAGWESLGGPLPAGTVAPVTVRITSLGGPKVVAVGDTVSLGAVGDPPNGIYSWKAEDRNVAKALEIQDSSADQAVTLKAIEPGESKVTVRFTSNSADQNGVHPFAEASLEFTTYSVDSIAVKPDSDDHVVKPNRTATEIEQPVEALITVNFGGILQVSPVPIPVVLGFEDPDDSANSPGIDANGPAGDDNAPVAKGGKRGPGSVMWRPFPGLTAEVSPDGQSARILTETLGINAGNVKATFLTSSIAADNYIFTVKAVDSKGRVLKEAKSGKITVRKALVFDRMFQMAGGSDVHAIMDPQRIDPAFSGDGFTDYSLGGDFRQLGAGPDSPQFIAPTDPPTAAETPTPQELADYASADPARKAAAKAAIERKALAWFTRNHDTVEATAFQSWVNRVGVVGPAVVGCRFIHAKEDGDSTTGQTNFWPAGIEIPAGNLLPDGGRAMVDPDNDWVETLGVEFEPGHIACIPLNASVTDPNQVQTGRHEAGHASDHEQFGLTDDHATSGLMLPGGGTLFFSDDSILRLRGWKR